MEAMGKLVFLLFLLPSMITSSVHDFDFMIPWKNRNDFPTGCYLVGSFIKCYRVSHDQTSNPIFAESQCHLNNGHLPVAMTEAIWARIWDDIIARNASLINQNIWLGPRVFARTTELVNLGGQSISLNNTNIWNNGNIGAIQAYDRCMYTYSDNRNWKWALNTHCNQHSHYMCEYSIGCKVDDLYLQIPNAEFKPCMSSDTILPHNSTIDIHCFEGHQLKGAKTAKCNFNTWTHIPQCVEGCPLPPKRKHAKLATHIHKPYFETGEEAIFVCDVDHFVERGYAETHFIMRCEENGGWSETNKDCVAVNEFKVVLIDASNAADSKINLTCPLLSSTDTSTVKWIKNGQEVKSTWSYQLNSDGSLGIDKVNENDIGLYFCQMVSGNRIEVPDTIYQILYTEDCKSYEDFNRSETVIVKEYLPLILSCHTGERNDLKWFKDGRQIWNTKKQRILPNGALFLPNAEMEDVGSYTCEALENDTTQCKRSKTYQVIVSTSAREICKLETKQSMDIAIRQLQQQPWLAKLWLDDGSIPFCYGTVIDNQWVMTSAACLEGFRHKNKLGLTVELYVNNNQKRVLAEAILVHPNYKRGSYENDIGVIKLEGPQLMFPIDMIPACIPDRNLIHKDYCHLASTSTGTVAGWGSLDVERVDELSFSVEDMIIVEQPQCQAAGTNRFSSQMFCANGTLTLQPNYSGDSGSPFLVIRNRKVHVVGIFSWGQRLTGDGLFDYFIDVSQHHTWLQSIISPNGTLTLA